MPYRHQRSLVAFLLTAAFTLGVVACPSPIIEDEAPVFAELAPEEVGVRHMFILDLYAQRIQETELVYRHLEDDYELEELQEFEPELFERFLRTYVTFQDLRDGHIAHLEELQAQNLDPHPFVAAHEAHLDAHRLIHETLAIDHEDMMLTHDRRQRRDLGDAHRALFDRHREMMELMDDMLFFAPQEVDVEDLPPP